MTAATATRGRLDLSGVERSTWTGWGGVALGILAWWIALPPLLLRSPAPSIVLALIAVGLGVWTLREGPKRLGWGAVAAGLIGGSARLPRRSRARRTSSG